MIFVILGTQKFQLNRLLQLVDHLCEERKITENVFAQIGHSDYKPQNYEYTEFLDRKDFDEKIKECSIVITHSGVGSIITSVQAGKPVIVFPRLNKYNEHVDDHQLEIAKAFEKKNYVLCCYEEDNLLKKIVESRIHNFDKYESSKDNIINLIKDFIEER